MEGFDEELENSAQAVSKKEKRKNKKPMTEAKIRVIALTITGIICAAIVVLGLKYIESIRSKSNAGAAEQTAAEQEEPSREEPSREEQTFPAVTEAPDTAAAENAAPAPAETTAEEKNADTAEALAATEAPAATEAAPVSEPAEGFTASGYADADGCYLFWRYGEEYDGCVLEIALTDGTEDYRPAASVPVSDGQAILASPDHSRTVGARFILSRTENGSEVRKLERTIVVENRTSGASGGTVDAADVIGEEFGYDIASLFS